MKNFTLFEMVAPSFCKDKKNELFFKEKEQIFR